MVGYHGSIDHNKFLFSMVWRDIVFYTTLTYAIISPDLVIIQLDNNGERKNKGGMGG